MNLNTGKKPVVILALFAMVLLLITSLTAIILDDGGKSYPAASPGGKK